ncbi:helix-turn-helix transcriptional regulator [Corynebacterium aquatimens]|uniref:helix-turn-helix transcriptional regulator n=1 Tax=Corynebacterium TaxID=1716 RepID=UPI001F2CFCD1|nr:MULTISPECIES: helix-turn-helix transcriptional regulator [Corynebacterium]QYH20173.1 helix-turn-helix transcriptional regulator [Corynebacterium aquatimens]UIZ92581.1 helix-turn-helix transcriptional regulator [Corynebacterium sp. CNCTC7651]
MADMLPQAYWASYALGLGHRVRVMRVMRGLTQARLAELAGVSRTLISNMERNEYNGLKCADPTLSTVYRLAAALYVPPAVLLPGAGDLVERPFAGPELGSGPASVAIALRWPNVPLDTARFDDEYLARGAPEEVPRFQRSLFELG